MNSEKNEEADGLSESLSCDVSSTFSYESSSNASVYHTCRNAIPSNNSIYISPMVGNSSRDLNCGIESVRNYSEVNPCIENNSDGDSSSNAEHDYSYFVVENNGCDQCNAVNTNEIINTENLKDNSNEPNSPYIDAVTSTSPTCNSSFVLSNGTVAKSTTAPIVDTRAMKVITPQRNCTLKSTFETKNTVSLARTKLNLQNSITQAKRVRFLRYGDKFYGGFMIPVSKVKYKTFESLLEDVTHLLSNELKLPGPILAIYTNEGVKITSIDEFDTKIPYICCCHKETTKKEEIYLGPQNNKRENVSLNQTKRPTHYLRLNIKREGTVRPRIIILIKSGARPRKITQLLLYKDNNQSFGNIKQAITGALKMNSGSIQKIFTLWGFAVRKLEDFFGAEDIFFIHCTEFVYYPNDFELVTEEIKVVEKICQQSPNVGKVYQDSEAQICSDVEYGSISEVVEGEFNIPKILHDRYKIENKIGEGHFAVVMKITNRRSKKPFALKIVNKGQYDNMEDIIDAEINVLRIVNHPYIISLFMVIERRKMFYLVTDYMAGGDIHDILVRTKQVSEAQCRLILKQLVLALQYLQSLHIIHRDIKVENLLVNCDENGFIKNIKLADFGLAVQTKKQLYALCGTPLYISPEMLSMNGYGKEIDIWAAGIVLYYILFKTAPFDDKDEDILRAKISSGIFSYPSKAVSVECKNLIENMLKIDPRTRYTCENILNHYWMKGKAT